MTPTTRYPQPVRPWISPVLGLLVLGMMALPVCAQDLQQATTPAEDLEILQIKGTQPISLTLKGRETVQVFHVNLPDLVRLVAEKNLDIAIVGAQIEQARGYHNQAIAGLLPSIRSFNTAERLQGGEIFIASIPFPVDRMTYSPRISADYVIQMGGKTLYQMSATRNQLKRIETVHDRVFQNALLETLGQYFTLCRDSALVDAAHMALKEAEAQLSFNEARFKAGFATRMDVTQSQVLYAERQSEMLRAENEKEISAIKLAAMIDLPLTVRLELTSEKLTPYTLMDDKISLIQLYDLAVENRPDVKELEFQIKEAKARYGAARADLFPTLTLSAYRRGIGPTMEQLQRTDQRFGSLSIDLLRNMGWGVMSEMQVQRGRIHEALLNKEKQLNEIQKSLAEAYQDSQLYREQMKVSRQKVEAALETYKLAGARLRSGVGLNLEVVEAQKELTQARAEFQTAIMNYNTAQLRLMYETGRLTPQEVLSGIAPPKPTETAQVKSMAAPLPPMP